MHDHSAATSHSVKTSVLIVGAGPVGLTLAMDLARRGIAAVVVEVRSAGDTLRGRTNFRPAVTQSAPAPHLTANGA